MRNQALSNSKRLSLPRVTKLFRAEYQIRMVTHEGAKDRLENSSGEWHLRHRQSQANPEAMQHQIQTMAQAIQREMLEKLTLLESKYQEQTSILQRQL